MKTTCSGEQGWRRGESACLPPMCPGFHSRTQRHMWVEFIVGSHPGSEDFSPGSPVFIPPQKIISKFQFDQEFEGHWFARLRLLCVTLVKQSRLCSRITISNHGNAEQKRDTNPTMSIQRIEIESTEKLNLKHHINAQARGLESWYQQKPSCSYIKLPSYHTLLIVSSPGTSARQVIGESFCSNTRKRTQGSFN